MRSLFVFILVVVAAAAAGAVFQPGSWYAQLQKPTWTPPNWLFAPVWTVLYVAIAVAGWRAWLAADQRIAPALVIWVLQLVLNALWSWLFFGLHQPGLALIDILLLLAAIVLFILLAHDRVASWLFVPYALWVAFASLLNFAIWRLNAA